jgi:hypothetical protein
MYTDTCAVSASPIDYQRKFLQYIRRADKALSCPNFISLRTEHAGRALPCLNPSFYYIKHVLSRRGFALPHSTSLQDCLHKTVYMIKVAKQER